MKIAVQQAAVETEREERCRHCARMVDGMDRSAEDGWCVFCWPGIERVRAIWRARGMID